LGKITILRCGSKKEGVSNQEQGAGQS